MMVQLADTLREVGSDSGVNVVALVSRPGLVLETIKLYQSKAGHLTPDMASKYAGTLLALVR